MQISKLSKESGHPYDGTPPAYYYDPYLDPEQEAKLKLEEEKANKIFTTNFRNDFTEEANALLDAIVWANASNEGVVDIPSSKYIPNSINCFSINSPSVEVLNIDIESTKACLVNGKAKASDALNAIFSQLRKVKYKQACKMCLVAVLLFAAANFCKPTSEPTSGVLASLASFKPVTSLIICK